MEHIKKELQKAIKEARENNGLTQYNLKLMMGAKTMQNGEFIIVTGSLSDERMAIINTIVKNYGVFVSGKYQDGIFSLRFKVIQGTKKVEKRTLTFDIVVGYTQMDKPIKEKQTVEFNAVVEGEETEEMETIPTIENPIVSQIIEGEYAGCMEITYGFVDSL